MRCLAVLRVLVLVLVCSSAASARTYRFEEYPLPNGYAYSGTVTTDGRTGDFDGTFISSGGVVQQGDSPIVSWDIQLVTPAGVDGTADERLTESNSFVQYGNSDGTLLRITQDEIELLPLVELTRTSNLRFVFSGAVQEVALDFLNNNAFGQIGSPGAVVSDLSESPFFGSVNTPSGNLLVATAIVPEPGASSLALFSGLAHLLVRRRKAVAS